MLQRLPISHAHQTWDSDFLLIVMESILEIEPVIRLGCFLGMLALITLWEVKLPRRQLLHSKRIRWLGNLGMMLINTGLLRILVPTAAVGFALVVDEVGWGLLNQLPIANWAIFVIAVISLDLAIYLQHVLFHAVPALWRIHRMHHADLDFDVTTGLRFHPIEILLSMGIKLGVIAVLGAPAAAVLMFEILLNATSMFNHGNIRLPVNVDRVLRWFVVTPDMHRVHHSITPTETNSNFGFNLPWWDRLLGTYRAQPVAGHEGMSIGIEQFRDPRDLGMDRMFIQPFRGDAGDYPINRDGSE
jgi:sterol desaturase/sphingolipid hydroxylase (fatty acid hydroxylase superfamily)